MMIQRKCKDCETLEAKALDGRGRTLATFRGAAIRELIARIDAAHPNCWGAVIRGERTSDGAHHGVGLGRILASREPRMIDGSFYSGWLVE